MNPFSTLLAHGLLYGVILSVLLTVLIVGSLYLRPGIWIADASAAVQAAAPPLTAADRRAKTIAGLLFFGILVGVMAASLLRLRTMSGGSPSFTDVALSVFIIFETFNLVDLVLIDWLVIEWWRPGFITFPSAEGLNLFRGYTHHFVGFLKGTAMSVVAGLFIAAVSVVF